jgi:hypothetical protein
VCGALAIDNCIFRGYVYRLRGMFSGGYIMPLLRGAISTRCLIVAVASALTGCGTLVPEIEELWGSPADVSIKVNAIVGQVQCELREAVLYLLAEDERVAQLNPRLPNGKLDLKLQWLKKWSAQVTLTLTIIESTALNPGATLNTPLNNGNIRYGSTTITVPQSYSFGIGGTLSSAATRIDTITDIYNLNDFATGKPTPGRTCVPAKHANGDLFVQSDLKLKQWLSEAVLGLYTETLEKFPTKPDTSVKNGFLSHDIKFEIISSGNLTPTWKLVRVSTNNGNLPLFSTSRDRTQDLAITMGPTAPQGLSVPAQNAALAAQIGAAVAAAIKGSQ